MTFAENINRICAEKGTNLTAIVKAVKGSSSFATAINTKGSLPKESEMLEMAKLLECSVMDFFADEEDLPETKPANEDEEDKENGNYYQDHKCISEAPYCKGKVS